MCSINHTGSAGAMKVVGMQKMFGRSVKLHGVWYTFYIGDGGTKSLDHICKSGPYLGHTITKAECVGHLQKRCQCQFAMSRANIKGKSSLTAKVLVAVKDAWPTKWWKPSRIIMEWQFAKTLIIYMHCERLLQLFCITLPRTMIWIKDINIARIPLAHGVSTKVTK